MIDDLIQLIQISDGDRLALERPRFRIAEQITARRAQILQRLAPERRTLAGARESLPGGAAFQDLSERGRDLHLRAQQLNADIRRAAILGELYDLASAVDRYAETVTRFVEAVRESLRENAAGDTGKRLLVILAGVILVVLLRARRARLKIIATIQRRLEELGPQLGSLRNSARLRGRIVRAQQRAVQLIDQASKLFDLSRIRSGLLRRGAVKFGGLVLRLTTGVGSAEVEAATGRAVQDGSQSIDAKIRGLDGEVGRIERDVREFIERRRRRLEQIEEDAKGRQEEARERVLRRRKEAPEQIPNLYIYITARDERVRSNHVPFDGFVLTRDAFLARGIMPPNGFNCRCVIVKLDSTRRDLLISVQVERLGTLEKAIAFFENRPIPAGASRDEGFVGP